MQADTQLFGVVMLSGHEYSARIVFNALQDRVPFVAVIREAPASRWLLFKRRIKKLGLITVGSQLVFQLGIMKLLRARASRRIAEIEREHRFDQSPIRGVPVHDVPSVNDETCRALLRKLAPAIVLVNGTRIISKETLGCIAARFINTHAGITPRYRGVHGGYWALAAGDAENCGVTVHLVDAGIDTGAILHQARIHPGPQDNFMTYPILQLAAGIPLIRTAIDDLRAGRVQVKAGPPGSRLWSHPTVGQYLGNCLRKGVR